MSLSGFLGDLKTCAEGSLVGISISALLTTVGVLIAGAPPIGVAVGLAVGSVIFGCALFLLAKFQPQTYVNTIAIDDVEAGSESVYNAVANLIATLNNQFGPLYDNYGAFLKGLQYDVTYIAASTIGNEYEFSNALSNYFSQVFQKVQLAVGSIYEAVLNMALTWYNYLSVIFPQASSSGNMYITSQYSSSGVASASVLNSISVLYYNFETPYGTLKLPTGFVVYISGEPAWDGGTFSAEEIYLTFPLISSFTDSPIFTTGPYYSDNYEVLSNGTVTLANTTTFPTSYTVLYGKLSPDPGPIGELMIAGWVFPAFDENLSTASINTNDATLQTGALTGYPTLGGYTAFYNGTLTNNAVLYWHTTGTSQPYGFYNGMPSPFDPLDVSIDNLLLAIYQIVNGFSTVENYANQLWQYYTDNNISVQTALSQLGPLNVNLLVAQCDGGAITSQIQALQYLQYAQQLQNQYASSNTSPPKATLYVSGVTLDLPPGSTINGVVYTNGVTIQLSDPFAVITPKGYTVDLGGMAIETYSGSVSLIPAGAKITVPSGSYIWRLDIWYQGATCSPAPVTSFTAVSPSPTGLYGYFLNVTAVTTLLGGVTTSENGWLVDNDNEILNNGPAGFTVQENYDTTYVPYNDAYSIYSTSGLTLAYTTPTTTTSNTTLILLLLLGVLVVGGVAIAKEVHNKH